MEPVVVRRGKDPGAHRAAVESLVAMMRSGVNDETGW